MTTVNEATKETLGLALVKQQRRKPRKPTKRLVAQLERELAEALSANDKLMAEVDRCARSLDQRRDELTNLNIYCDKVVNERDRFRIERDDSSRWARENDDIRMREMREFCNELGQVQAENDELRRMNQNNFDKAVRTADVAAVLASRLIENTDEGPVKIMVNFGKMIQQMNLTQNVLDEVESVLLRGYSAQVKQIADEVRQASY